MIFKVLDTFGKARIGHMITANSDGIKTPVFMPVGTQATVKGMRFDQLLDKFPIILANTYHLLLRPGLEFIKYFNGVHNFSNWPNALLTDSGGFQVMSLQKLRKITREGVTFNSHIDGKKYLLTPESVTEAQHIFGSDISMIFDECTPYPISHVDAEKSMELSIHWAERSRKAYKVRDLYKQFGIVQGADFKDLRIRSSDALKSIGFEGYAIGGVVGNQSQIMHVLDYTVPLLPDDKPHYLMGVGKPTDIVQAVMRGIDMFDCILPTRSARHGQVFTSSGIINIDNAKFKLDKSSLDDKCDCYTCQNYMNGYLYHLFKRKEILASMLLTEHNLHYYYNLMKHLRWSIEKKDWSIMRNILSEADYELCIKSLQDSCL